MNVVTYESYPFVHDMNKQVKVNSPMDPSRSIIILL